MCNDVLKSVIKSEQQVFKYCRPLILKRFAEKYLVSLNINFDIHNIDFQKIITGFETFYRSVHVIYTGIIIHGVYSI